YTSLFRSVTFVLAVNHRRHALEAFDHLLLGHYAMAHPVGHVLAGDTQGSAVFHQCDIVDVRHLGTADALLDPAHHVAEDALRVVVQLVALFLVAPVGVLGQRDGQDIVHRGLGALGQFGLTGEHVDLVVVHGVQGGGSRGRYPGGVGT